MKRLWGFFWILVLIEAVFGIVGIFRVPSAAGNAAVFGLSPVRLALAAGFVGVCFISVWRLKKRRSDFEARWFGRLGAWLGWLCAAVWTFFRSPYARGVNFEAIYIRVSPWLIFLTLFAMESIVFSALGRRGSRSSAAEKQLRRAFYPAIAFGLLTFIFVVGLRLIALRTGLGLTVLSGTFYRQGVSLLDGPLWAALLTLALAGIIWTEVSRGGGRAAEWVRKHDAACGWVVFALLWLGAAIAWRVVPFEGRSYFLPALRPPNFNYYPSSDAENYDLLALNLFTGNGFRNGMTVVRPLYAAFLAVLHQFAGTDYLDLTNMQIVVLALIPAMIFRLGRRLRMPWGGALAAVWVIAREAYAIRLTPLIQVSNSRLLMSELPMALILLWIAELTVRWLEDWDLHGAVRLSSVVLLGTACGMGFLLRTQSILIAPVLGLIFVIAAFRRGGLPKRRRARELGWIGAFFAVIAAVIVPWIVYQAAFPNRTVPPAASEGAYLTRLYARAAGVPETKGESVVHLTLTRPGVVGAEISGHLANNLLSTILVLPLRTEAVREPGQWFFDPTNFWYRESSREVLAKNGWQWGWIAAVFALGIGGAVRRSGYRAVVPVGIFLAYALSCSVAMTSGFRFILPVDWFALLIFAFGAESTFRLISAAASGTDSVDLVLDRTRWMFHAARRERAAAVWAVGLAIFIAGLLPALDFPALLPKRRMERTELSREWTEIHREKALFDELDSFEEKLGGELEIVRGMAVYPRVYLAGEGDADGVSSAKRGAAYSRLVWMVLTEDERVLTAVLPLDCRSIVEPVPDPADVVLVGKSSGDSFAVLTIDSVGGETPFHFESLDFFLDLTEEG